MSLSFLRKFVRTDGTGKVAAAVYRSAKKKIVVDAGRPAWNVPSKYHPDFKWEPTQNGVHRLEAIAG